MATLTGTTIQSTYDSLLKVSDNDAITSTLKRITDGLGNNTPLFLSTSAVQITSSLSVTGAITGSNLSGTNTGDETKSSIETKLGAASASNSGFLTSTDWSTFNNKVAGIGTLNKLAKFSSSSSIADSNITDTGSAVTIGVATSVTGSLTASSLIRTGGTSSQFLKADGSVDSTSYQPVLTNPVTGTGTGGRIPVWLNSSSIGDSQIFTAFDESIGAMIGIGATPNDAPTPHRLFVSGTSYFTNALRVNAGITATSYVISGGNNNQLVAAGGGVVTAGTNITISGGTISANNTSQWITSGSNIYYNTGNVSIGTTSTDGRLFISGGYLRINEDGAGTRNMYLRTSYDGTLAAIQVSTATDFVIATSNTERFRITSAGNVGIGTTSPVTRLHIVDTANTFSGSFSGGASGNLVAIGTASNVPSINGYTSGFASTANLSLQPNGGNVGIGATSPTELTEIFRSQNATTRLLINNPDTTNTNSRASLRTNANGVIGEMVSINNLGVYLGAASNHELSLMTNGSQRIVITSAGNVGIGTTAPIAPLEVFRSNSGGLGGHIVLNNNGSAVGNETALMFGDGASTGIRAAISSTTEDLPYRGDIKFKTGVGAYSSLSTRMIITGAGSVGIGTTTPTAPLDTNGVRIGRNWNISGRATVRLDSNGTGNPADILFAHDPGANQGSWTGVYWSISSRAADNGNRLTFWRGSGNPSNPSESILMTLDPTGNVGIGNTSPAARLTIAGSGIGNALIGDAGFGGGNYSGVSFNGTLSTTSYNILSSPTDVTLYINRPSGADIQFRMNNSSQMILTAGGFVGIGTTVPLYALHVVGNIFASADVLAFSDISVKTNIRPIENALEKVLNSRGVVYDRIDTEEKDNIGFIAQELEVNFPELVSENVDGTKSVKYQNAVAVLFEAIKELQAQINELKK